MIAEDYARKWQAAALLLSHGTPQTWMPGTFGIDSISSDVIEASGRLRVRCKSAFGERYTTYDAHVMANLEAMNEYLLHQSVAIEDGC